MYNTNQADKFLASDVGVNTCNTFLNNIKAKYNIGSTNASISGVLSLITTTEHRNKPNDRCFYKSPSLQLIDKEGLGIASLSVSSSEIVLVYKASNSDFYVCKRFALPSLVFNIDTPLAVEFYFTAVEFLLYHSGIDITPFNLTLRTRNLNNNYNSPVTYPVFNVARNAKEIHEFFEDFVFSF